MNFQNRATQSACVSNKIYTGEPTSELSWLLYDGVESYVNLNTAKHPYKKNQIRPTLMAKIQQPCLNCGLIFAPVFDYQAFCTLYEI